MQWKDVLLNLMFNAFERYGELPDSFGEDIRKRAPATNRPMRLSRP
jgi:hypothetical protein